jgi:flagellar hook-associated protein 3 FlgL
MTGRIGDYAQHARTTALLVETQARSRATQTQLSSGKVAQTFQGLGPGVEPMIQGKSALLQNEQFQRNNSMVIDRLTMMESSVASLADVAERLRVVLLQRLSDGVADPGTLTTEVGQLLDQAVASLNAEIDGSYLFAGARTATRPVQLDPSFVAAGAPDTSYYQGDALELTVMADAKVAVTYGITADRAGFQELIGALRTFIEADAIDDRTTLAGALSLVNDALPKIADYRAEIGSGQRRLEQINDMHRDAQVYLERRIGDVENIDIAAAVTRLTQDQVLLESAMASLSRINQLSLANYL